MLVLQDIAHHFVAGWADLAVKFQWCPIAVFLDQAQGSFHFPLHHELGEDPGCLLSWFATSMVVSGVILLYRPSFVDELM